MNISRRHWLLATACWTEILRAQSRDFTALDAITAAEIDAIARRIIPDDETPGAGAAGVIFFIDRSLAGYDQDKRELYTRGLANTQAKRTELYPASKSIATLSATQQDELLKSIQDTEFFQQVRLHTALGFFGHPMHGGNRDMVGWKLIGVEHAMQYESPFGYYDAEALRTSSK
jgi:gluconate 2-dehydrogenase gamma chain